MILHTDLNSPLYYSPPDLCVPVSYLQMSMLSLLRTPYAYYGSWLGLLGCLAMLLRQHLAQLNATDDKDKDKEEKSSSGDDKTFNAFRNNYITVFLIMMAADWFQGPYVYALYENYGFSIENIGKLFIVGFASSMVSGPIVGSAADK